MSDWIVFRGSGKPHDGLANLPEPPPWRRSTTSESPRLPIDAGYDLEAERPIGAPFHATEEVQRAVNAALCLRRPLLVTGKPGVGKSSLASAVAYELRMGPLLKWPITSRSTVKSGLYEYDAVGRLQARETDSHIGDYLRLGPLGTALYPTSWPRALLVDEIDKGDIDLPNDLLNVIEDGSYEIPELVRAKGESFDVRVHGSSRQVRIVGGRVACAQFPFIVMTSNGEREFPAPFLRRCIRITIPQPTYSELAEIIGAHLDQRLEAGARAEIDALIKDFLRRRESQELATDQLLNAVFVVMGDGRRSETPPDENDVVHLLLKQLTTPQSQ